jgi:hypothetical protein
VEQFLTIHHDHEMSARNNADNTESGDRLAHILPPTNNG